MPNLRLFSTADEKYLGDILDACRFYLKGRDEARVAYLPLASLYVERWQEYTQEMFKGIAELETINAELMTLPEMEAILRRCALVFIPGGNTYLLSHRLHISGLMPFLRKKVQGGLPVVAFSAGTILCGLNILTSRDMNAVEATRFDGLNASPFNFRPHYPLDDYGQSVADDWLRDYHFFHDNPIVMLADGACVKMEGKKTSLARGEAWILRKNREKEKLDEGKPIA
ncbi:MAG: Type 1 glutamine amidotransferase-like domain-containing protein [Chloroflexota bacterium]